MSAIEDGGRAALGHSSIFTPEVINDIHVKAELGRYRMRGFSMFKPIPHWDELMFMPGTLTRFVIEGYREKCETKTILGARFAKKPIERPSGDQNGRNAPSVPASVSADNTFSVTVQSQDSFRALKSKMRALHVS